MVVNNLGLSADDVNIQLSLQLNAILMGISRNRWSIAGCSAEYNNQVRV